MTAVDQTDRSLPTPTAARSRAGGARRAQQPAGGRRSWMAWLVLLLVVAGAGYGGYRLVEHRLAGENELALDRVVLVADPVPVGSPDAAVVASVAVAGGAAVSAGDDLAVIELAVGGGRTERITLTAPVDGNVVRVDAQPGSVVRAGESVVTLYAPDSLSFRTDLPVEAVEPLRTGMTATISGPGLTAPVEARVDRVVPVIDDAGATSSTMTVILTPVDDSSVAQLVPGVPLTGTLDTTPHSSDGGSVLETGA